MTTLRKLLVTGNPLRTIRSSLVCGPTPALLKYFRSRLSSNEEGSSSSPAKVDYQIFMATRLSLSSKELCLSVLGLSFVPSTVWETEGIVKVDLSRNFIKDIPKELSSCTSLQIPSNGFQALSKLQIVDLSGNAALYYECPAFSCLLQLHELYVRRMQLHEVPSDLLRLHDLRILDLSQNALISIPKEFRISSLSLSLICLTTSQCFLQSWSDYLPFRVCLSQVYRF